MKIVRISDHGTLRWGRLEGDVVKTTLGRLELHEVSGALLDREISVEATSFKAPVTPASKIVCVGLNYRDHVMELGREMPEKPVIFTRFPDSLVGPNEAILLPIETERFDYEGELAVVIGRGGRRIDARHALDHVLGYTVLNDGTLRDFQRHTAQFTPGKNFARSGSAGPWIVTREEFGDIRTQCIRTLVNGETRQESSLDQLVFDVPTLIAYISQWTELRPGDVIATGTPGGVGDGLRPPRWMRDGDEVRVEIEGLGVLSNRVAAEARSQG